MLPFFPEIVNNVTVKVGQSAVLKCKVENLNSYKVWKAIIYFTLSVDSYCTYLLLVNMLLASKGIIVRIVICRLRTRTEMLPLNHSHATLHTLFPTITFFGLVYDYKARNIESLPSFVQQFAHLLYHMHNT